MEFKIDIDMDKIDYDAINKQIQAKVEELNISDKYEIDNKIESKVSECVDDEVSYYINKNWYYHNQLSDEAKSSITKLATDKINDKVAKVVTEIFEKMPDEELDEIIVGLIPAIICNCISSEFKSYMNDYKARSISAITQIADQRVRDALKRSGC